MRYACRGGCGPVMLALLTTLLIHAPLSAAAHAETKHVLVLSSSERPFAPQSGFADALVRDLIRASRDPIQFVEVSVQAARASGDAPGVLVAERIRSAFGAARLDLVMTIGGPAATFAQQFRQKLFAATPMLIAGVDRRFVENARFTDNETTVATQHDPGAIVDEILRLLPGTRSVMVVVGASQLEQFWLQEMKREFRRFGDRVQFSWTNELSFDEIKERCRTMPPRSAIFFAILAVDGKGEPRVERDTVSAIRGVANAPVFALYGMGSGIVGGPLLSSEELSRTTVQVALRVLAGESPGRIKTPVQRTGPPTYDARELRRWNIDERRLPPASRVLFREPTLWERSRGAIALAALLGGVPIAGLLLVGYLLKQRRGRNRHSVAEAALASAPGDGATWIWTAGADGQRVKAGQSPGATGPDAWTACMHPEDVERSRENYRRALERRESFQMEYRIREADGAERWILDTGLVRFSGDVFDGYIGSAVDITRLGRARAELSDLSRHLIQTQERETAAIARTLHEDVCQRMVALTLRLHSAQTAAQNADVDHVREELSNLVAELAAVSDPVHRRLELLGLAIAGRRFCEELSAEHDVTIHFEDGGVARELPADIALALFRVLQEATINAVVHSGSREVRVSLCGTADDIRLRVVDGGVGFDPQRPVPGGRVGLVAIRERLKLVDGNCEIVSGPGQGTRVEVCVPIRV